MKKLLLNWHCRDTDEDIVVGILEYIDDGYEFSYSDSVRYAIKRGFYGLVTFENCGTLYRSKNLFPVFKNRLPDKKRKDIESILNRYNLTEYDEYELLKQGTKLPVDDLSFRECVETEETKELREERQVIQDMMQVTRNKINAIDNTLETSFYSDIEFCNRVDEMKKLQAKKADLDNELDYSSSDIHNIQKEIDNMNRSQNNEEKELKTRTLDLEMTCLASYRSYIEVPANYTLEEAKAYAKERLDSVPVDELLYLEDYESCLEGDMELWEFSN